MLNLRQGFARRVTGGVPRKTVERLVAMQDVTIKVRENGPYLVKGPVTLTDADGNAFVVESADIALCRCGGSQSKPFCDGSHKTNGFTATQRATTVQETS